MPTPISGPNVIAEVTIPNSNQAVELTLDGRITRCHVLFETNDGQVAFIGTEGAGLSSTSTLPVPADTLRTIRVRPPGQSRSRDGSSLFIAAATAPTTFRILTDRG